MCHIFFKSRFFEDIKDVTIHLGHVWDIIWLMNGASPWASFGACLEQHLWGISGALSVACLGHNWVISEASSGACLGHHLGQIWASSGALFGACLGQYGLPAYSHQSYSHLVGICHNDEGWEYDAVTFPPCINPYLYIDRSGSNINDDNDDFGSTELQCMESVREIFKKLRREKLRRKNKWGGSAMTKKTQL